jgi:hypothetical protein
MKHDMNTRRVLRTKRQYLEKFNTCGVFIILLGVYKITSDHKKGKTDTFISSKITKISKEDLKEDACIFD